MEAALKAVTTALKQEAPRLTEMDRIVGDGDLGISLERGAKAIEAELPTYPLDDPSATLHAIGVTLQRALGGSSGPLYAVFFLRAAARLRGANVADHGTWAAAFRAGCDGIAELGGAVRGDRTMLDALLPAAEAFAAAGRADDALRSAAAAAAHGAKATAAMTPRKGRSSYLGERAVGHPDPGAEAVAVWLAALAEVPIN